MGRLYIENRIIMKDIYIFGASGYAKETVLLIKEMGEYIIKAFVDKNNLNQKFASVNNFTYPIISEDNFYQICKKEQQEAVISIANWEVVNKLVMRFDNYCNFPNIIHPSSAFKGKYNIGRGNIISYDCLFTEDITIGSFNRFNVRVAIGHNSTIGDYNHFNSSVNIAGNVVIGNNNLFGINSIVLQNLTISDGNTIGAASLILKNITKTGTYFGVPAKRLNL